MRDQILVVMLQPELFPVLAGKQQDLAFFAELFQQLHGFFHAPLVEAHQGIVQNQGAVRGQDLPHRQTQSQIDLVAGALAAPGRGPEGAFAAPGRQDIQLVVDEDAVVDAAGEPAEIIFRPAGDIRGEPPLELRRCGSSLGPSQYRLASTRRQPASSLPRSGHWAPNLGKT